MRQSRVNDSTGLVVISDLRYSPQPFTLYKSQSPQSLNLAEFNNPCAFHSCPRASTQSAELRPGLFLQFCSDLQPKVLVPVIGIRSYSVSVSPIFKRWIFGSQIIWERKVKVGWQHAW